MAKEQKTIFSPAIAFAFVRLFCVWLVLISSFGNSAAERLPIKIYTSADGLGSSFVSSVMRDSRGFLWFSTRDGLSRFDGQRFVTYQVGAKESPPGIEQILETRDGIYWITTTGGLYRYDPKKIVENPAPTGDRPTLDAQFISESRGFLFEDSAGNLWVGGDSLYRVTESNGKFTLQKIELELPPDITAQFDISNIIESRDKSLWIVTDWGLLRLLPDKREIFYRMENVRTDGASSVLEDRAGRIWLAHLSQIYVIKPETLDEVSGSGALTIRRLEDAIEKQTKNEVVLPEKSGEVFRYADLEAFTGSGSPKFLYQTSDEHIWISAGNGAMEFDGRRFTLHTNEQGFLKGGGRMVEDANGNLWFGWATGAMRLDRDGLSTFTPTDGLKNPAILAIGETSDGKFYIGDNDFSISRLDTGVFQSARPQLPPNSRASWTSNPIFQDSAGEWWFLTTEKLYRFAATDNLDALAGQRPLAVYGTNVGFKSDVMFHIFEDSRKDLWISNRAPDSASYGFARWNRASEKFYFFSEADGFPPNKSVSAFAEDASGNIWVGFYEGGLARFAGNRFTEFSAAPETGGVVTALHFDKQGRLWMTSSLSGLSRVEISGAEQISFTNYTTENGLASNNVRSLVEDDFGQIYVGTARGVNRLTTETGRVKHYSVNDGLAGDFVNVAFRAKDGALWFGTPNGVSRLVPKKENQTIAPSVWLSGLRIAGESQTVSELGSAIIENLELAPGQNNLQIDFFGIDFNPNESLRYQFMLEGADKDWSQPTEQRTVNFSNLSAGDYRFLVRAVNADGVHTPQPAAVAFKLLPPIYERWWFIALATLALAGFIFALDRFRVKKTRQVETALVKSKESETRFRTLAETASDAIITIDADSNIVFINEAVEKIFGYAASELIGEKLTMLMPEDLRPRHDAGLDHYTTTNRKRISWTGVELRGRHKTGAEIPLELSFGEFELNGKRYFTGVARDVSERKRAEEALQKSREERIAELQRVRTRIATDLHDDIGSSLTQIAVLTEVARNHAQLETVHTPLERITSVSNELVEAMSDIVWAINPRKDHLSDLTLRMRRFASEILTDREIDFEFTTPDQTPDAPLGANLRREIFLIFKESVNNLVKHSEATEAAIDFLLEEDFLTLRLKDNGRGFNPASDGENGSFDWEKAAGGNGLLSMRRRAAELGGEYRIESEIGKGTTVTLRIPLEKNSTDAG